MLSFAQLGLTAGIHLLLKNGANVDICNEKGETPFFIACSEGDLESVKILFGYGASINKASKNLFTPLCAAIESKTLEIVKFLVENGADVNQVITHILLFYFYNGKNLNTNRIQNQNP